MKRSENTRFAIIGAGAAGLTAAEALKEKGYKNIMILEKESFAGGKCTTVEIKGRDYELGAGVISANNKTIMNLVEKYNVPLKPISFGQNILYDLEKGELAVDLFSLPEQFSFFWQLLLRYYRFCRNHPKVQEPGFKNCDPSLFIPFHQWAKENEIPLVEKSFERFFTGFGYGYWDEIPAAYVLKYNDWPTLVAFLRKQIFTFPKGIQHLWEQVAAQHNVFYNKSVTKIKRTTSGVEIKTYKNTFEADVLILACPLDNSLSFLDASPFETELFSKIQHNEYITYVCEIDDFPPHSGFIPEHFNSSKKGHPVFWYKRYPDNNIYSIYVLSEFNIDYDQILENVLLAIDSLGGNLKHILEYRKWKYFPHVDATEMQNGYYDKLENLQGNYGTYYTGELLNFSTVELTAAYSKALVNRFF